MHTLKEFLKVAMISFIMLFLVGVSYAWTEPGAAPPTPNAAAPITASSTSQYRSGSLGVGISALPSAVLETQAPTVGAVNTVLRGKSNNGAFSIDLNMQTDGTANFGGNYSKFLINTPVNICKKVSYTTTGSVGCGANYYVVNVMDASGNLADPVIPPTAGTMLCCRNAD